MPSDCETHYTAGANLVYLSAMETDAMGKSRYRFLHVHSAGSQMLQKSHSYPMADRWYFHQMVLELLAFIQVKMDLSQNPTHHTKVKLIMGCRFKWKHKNVKLKITFEKSLGSRAAPGFLGSHRCEAQTTKPSSWIVSDRDLRVAQLYEENVEPCRAWEKISAPCVWQRIWTHYIQRPFDAPLQEKD